MTNEKWATIAVAPSYEVSSAGRVRRGVRAKCGIPAGKMIAARVDKWDGYVYVMLHCGMKRIRCSVHRLVAIAFLGEPIYPRTQVAHYDGTRTNNCLSNLRWATQTENMEDARRHGTMRYTRTGTTKIPPGVLATARDAVASGQSIRSVAKRIGFGFTVLRRALICPAPRWIGSA